MSSTDGVARARRGWRRSPWRPAAAAAAAAATGGDRRRPAAAAASRRPTLKALDKLGTPEGEVNILAWAGLRRGRRNDPTVDWVTPFEKADRLPGQRQDRRHLRRDGQLMKTGQYDVVSASGDAIAAADRRRRRRAGQHRPGAELRRHLRRSEEQAVELASTASDVRHPARLGRQPADVPHRQGQAGARPRGARCSTRRSPYKGKVTAYDSPIYIADAALYLMKTKPDLGIKNPYALDDKQFDAAVDLLKTQNARRRRVLVGLPQGGRRRSRPATPWSAPPGRSSPTSPRPRRRRSKAMLPKEGATGWSDTWMVGAKSQAPELRLQVDGLDRQPEGQRRRSPSSSARRRPTAKACDETADKNFCDDLPRRRRGLLRPDLVLDHADRAVPRRPHRRHLHGLRRLDAGLDRRSRADASRAGGRAVQLPARPASCTGTRGCGWRCCSRRRCCGWWSPTSARSRSLLLTAFWTHRRLHRRRRADVHARQLPRRCSPARRLPHGRRAHASASRLRSRSSTRCSRSRSRSSWPRSPRRGRGGCWSSRC